MNLTQIIEIAKKFSRYVEPLPADADEGTCLMWQGARSAAGYGRIRVGKDVCWAHRIAWMIERGPLAPGVQVLHRCDVPGCVRFEHLFTGTCLDNARDRNVKGRQAYGLRNGNGRFSDELIAACRAYQGTQREAAALFGISSSYVCQLRKWPTGTLKRVDR